MRLLHNAANNKDSQLENLGSRSNDSTHKVLAASLIASGFAGGLSIIKTLGARNLSVV